MLPEHWIDAEPCPDCGAGIGTPCFENCPSQEWPSVPVTVEVEEWE